MMRKKSRLMRRGKIEPAYRWGLLSDKINLSQLMEDCDQRLFNKVLSNPAHVIHPLLPPEKDTPYGIQP